MPKRVLGRGLGELLPDEGTRPPVQNGVGHKLKDPADLGPGLRALVTNGNGHNGGLFPNGARTPSAARTWVVLSLTAADLFLVLLTLFWQHRVSGTFDGLSTAACVAGIMFAAWLGCLAAWVHFRG